MTEYKMGYLSFLNHLPVLLLEGLLLLGAMFVSFYQWIWFMIIGVIIIATLITILIDSYKTYGLSKQVFYVRLGKRKTEYLLTSIKTVRERKWNLELGFKDSGKVKTIYLGWYINKYKELKEQLFENLKQLDEYDRIIFID